MWVDPKETLSINTIKAWDMMGILHLEEQSGDTGSSQEADGGGSHLGSLHNSNVSNLKEAWKMWEHKETYGALLGVGTGRGG